MNCGNNYIHACHKNMTRAVFIFCLKQEQKSDFNDICFFYPITILTLPLKRSVCEKVKTVVSFISFCKSVRFYEIDTKFIFSCLFIGQQSHLCSVQNMYDCSFYFNVICLFALFTPEYSKPYRLLYVFFFIQFFSFVANIHTLYGGQNPLYQFKKIKKSAYAVLNTHTRTLYTYRIHVYSCPIVLCHFFTSLSQYIFVLHKSESNECQRRF